jgi:hypothetical protein
MSWMEKLIHFFLGRPLVKDFRRSEWSWVPQPNYRCSRGKQTNCKYGDYW